MDKVLYEGKSKILCSALDDDSYVIRCKNTVAAFDGKIIMSGATVVVFWLTFHPDVPID